MGVIDVTYKDYLTSIFNEGVWKGEGYEWIAQAAQTLTANQPRGHTYGMTGTLPGWQETKGPITSRTLDSWQFSIAPKQFHNSIAFHRWDIDFDQFNTLRPQIAQLGETAQALRTKLVMSVLTNGTSTACFDGANFFSASHIWGSNSGTQSNNVTIDISDLGAVSVANSGTVPSPEEARKVLLRAGRTMLSFKDSEGNPQPVSGTANFVVVAPLELMEAFAAGLDLIQPQGLITSMGAMTRVKLPMQFDVYGSALLDSAPTVFYMLRTDSSSKPLAIQELEPLTTRVFEPFENNMMNSYQFLAQWSGNAAPWDWSKALRVTLAR